MSTMISPTDMADIYWKRLNRSAFREIDTKIFQFSRATDATKQYWLEVKAELFKRVHA